MAQMTTREYTVRFPTPAFLGDAEQNGRWRTPPFKALLRQWWRVVYTADHDFQVDVKAMRHEEGLLFGHAWLDDDRDGRGEKVAARKSLVRLRLDRWAEGDLNKKKTHWPADVQVIHPEVTNREGKSVPVGGGLYLGYGPLTYDNQRRATTLKNNAAIQAGELAKLSLAWPAQHPNSEVQKILDANNQKRRLHRALWLMDRYGTVGGRSRNGWGSFSLLPLPPGEGWGEGHSLPQREWRECLTLDWPHAIGRDTTGPLIWQTKQAYDDWKTLMRDLAIIKIGLRTQFVFPPSVKPPHPLPLERHWLSYPITTHDVREWKSKNLRLPNSLRFKVRCDHAHPTKLRGVIFHMPCVPPLDFRPDKSAIEQTWQTVHDLLGELCKPSGRTYSMIADQTRRSKLKPELDKVLLELVKE